MFGFFIFQDVSGVARVTRSPDESLRDPGTYLVYFMKSARKAQLKDFVTQLISANFEAEVLSEFFSIKTLSARLSEQALSWVRIILKITI